VLFVKSGLKKVSSFHILDFCLFMGVSTRVAAIVAHVSWLFTYLRLFPAAKKAHTAYLSIGFEYVDGRIQEGSKIKDFLVSNRLLSLVFYR
jgi:hypothetical protein